MEIELPLTVQHPEDHEPTIEELMLDIRETILAKDTKIAQQRKQLEDVRDALKRLLGTNATENVVGASDVESLQAYGQAQC